MESLRRTIEHLHRVHLGSMLREQTLEKQLREVEGRMRLLERERVEGGAGLAAAGVGVVWPTSILSAATSPVGSGDRSPAGGRGAALTSLACPVSLPPGLAQQLSSLLVHLSPSRSSEQRRISVLSWLKALIRKSLGAQCYPVNSYALKTYLAHELMTVSAFFSRAHEPSWLQRVVNALCQEAYATSSGAAAGEATAGVDVSVPTASALHLIQSVTVFFATSKQHAVVRCCIGGIDVSIYGNNVPALGSLALFEHVDQLVGKEHLFKRSILLFKLWASTRGIYGGDHEDDLLSGLFLRTLVLFVFNRFHSMIAHPLDALLCLLAYFEDFDWDTSALSIYGPVLLPSIDSNQLEAVTSGPHAWPADLTPLVPPSLIHSYQVQTRKDQLPSSASATSTLLSSSFSSSYPSTPSSSIPRVNSSMFLDIPTDSTVGRSNSDTNLAGLVSRSSSSSSLSSLTAGSGGVGGGMVGVVDEAGGGGDRFTPLQQLRPSSKYPTTATSTFRSKSYTSLASLDYANTPEHSPQPVPASYHGPPHYLNPTPGSFTSTSSSSSTSSLSSSSSLSSPPFPPTISTTPTHHQPPPAPSRPPSAFAAESEEADEEEDDDASSSSYSSDGDDPPPPSPSPSPHIPIPPPPTPLDLYQHPHSHLHPTTTNTNTPHHLPSHTPTYPTCSLNVLDAIERGKNLGVNVVYRYQYRVRVVLSEGWRRLREALDGGEKEGGNGGEEGSAVLGEIFDAPTLAEYRERLYREQKVRGGATASPPHTPAEEGEGNTPKAQTQARHSSSPQAVVAEPAAAPPVRSTLNPHSSEFIPASALAASASTRPVLSLTSSSPTSASPPSLASPISDESFSASLLPSTSLTSPTSFDSLDGNLSKILANLTHARQFELPTITERDLLHLLTLILQDRGVVPVGRLGSLLHDRTNNHSLPAVLKESYGGLKRLLERHPDVFVVGKDHPYNPHVKLKAAAGAGAAGGAGGGGAGEGGAGGKRKVQRRRTRVRRVHHRGGSTTNLAALSSSSSSVPLSSSSSSSSSLSSLHPSQRPPLTPALALDCEMIGTGSGGLHSILARVSLVNSHLEPVYDSFVQPSDAVTDYRTHVSGITAEHLRDAPPFAVVQREVASMIKGRVLVGHGLGGDMQVLCLGHPRWLLRDTAHCKLICPVRPLGLKRLMSEKFGVEVQEGEHDSVEDAKCAMRLYLLVQAEWEHSIHQQGHTHTNEPQTTVYHIMP